MVSENEPTLREVTCRDLEALRRLEADGDFTARLAMLEELKSLPFGAVWDYYCLTRSAPVGPAWLADVREYERHVLAGRD